MLLLPHIKARPSEPLPDYFLSKATKPYLSKIEFLNLDNWVTEQKVAGPQEKQISAPYPHDPESKSSLCSGCCSHPSRIGLLSLHCENQNNAQKCSNKQLWVTEGEIGGQARQQVLRGKRNGKATGGGFAVLSDN